jgi:hypothetical protein
MWARSLGEKPSLDNRPCGLAYAARATRPGVRRGPEYFQPLNRAER